MAGLFFPKAKATSGGSSAISLVFRYDRLLVLHTFIEAEVAGVVFQCNGDQRMSEKSSNSTRQSHAVKQRICGTKTSDELSYCDHPAPELWQ
jgi:hypothetical protein